MTSYDPGDVVMFAKALEKKGVERGVAYKVAAASPGGKAVRLSGPAGISIDWEPHRWGQVQAFHAVDCDLRSGDRIEFTRNAPAAGRVNGLAAQVLNVDPATRSAAIRTERGRIQHLALDNPADQHIRHSYVHTAFAAQGRTAERVLMHAESARTNLIDQATLYVAISRARAGAEIYTDDRAKLIRALAERSGEQSVAIASMGPAKQRQLAASI